MTVKGPALMEHNVFRWRKTALAVWNGEAVFFQLHFWHCDYNTLTRGSRGQRVCLIYNHRFRHHFREATEAGVWDNCQTASTVKGRKKQMHPRCLSAAVLSGLSSLWLPQTSPRRGTTPFKLSPPISVNEQIGPQTALDQSDPPLILGDSRLCQVES